MSALTNTGEAVLTQHHSNNTMNTLKLFTQGLIPVGERNTSKVEIVVSASSLGVQTISSHSAITIGNLPLEVRQHIFKFVVTVPQSVHVYEARDSLGYHGKYGWRLSLCEETAYDLLRCECRCQQGQNSQVQSDHFDNALLLVSKSIRREALGVFFLNNRFTFGSFSELQIFAMTFPNSAAKIKSLRLLVSLDAETFISDRDSGQASDLFSRAYMRGKLVSLQNLDLHMVKACFMADDDLHQDHVNRGICAFAFPRVLTFKCTAHVPVGVTLGTRTTGRRLRSSSLWASTMAQKIECRIMDVFCGPYNKFSDIKLPEPRKPEEPVVGLPPISKKGIIVLDDI